jgi:hypothetical protein
MLSLNKYMFQRQHLTTSNTCLHFLLLPLSLVRAVILIWFSLKMIELWLYMMGDPLCNVCFMCVCFWLRTWNGANDYSHIPTWLDTSRVRLSQWSPLSIWLFCLCCISIYQQIAFAFVDLSLHLFLTQTCSSEVQHNNRFRTISSTSSFLQWKMFALLQPLNDKINTYTKYVYLT